MHRSLGPGLATSSDFSSILVHQERDAHIYTHEQDAHICTQQSDNSMNQVLCFVVWWLTIPMCRSAREEYLLVEYLQVANSDRYCS